MATRPAPLSLKGRALRLLSQREHAFKLYSELSAPHWQSDVVIWPETAIPAFAEEVPDMIASLAHTARAAGTTAGAQGQRAGQ